MSKKKVMVAMSGGVDSSVTAALLIDQGYECVGVTMRITASVSAIEGGPGGGGRFRHLSPRRRSSAGVPKKKSLNTLSPPT